MFSKRKGGLLVSSLGYAISLMLMAFSGWALYGSLAPVVPQDIVTALRLYQAFLFSLAFLAFATVARAAFRFRFAVAIASEAGFLLGLSSFAVAFWGGADVASFFGCVAATLIPLSRASFLVLWIDVFGGMSGEGLGRCIVLAWVASSLFLVVSGAGFGSASFLLPIAATLSLANVAMLCWCMGCRFRSKALEPADTSGSASLLECGSRTARSFWSVAWPLVLFGMLLTFCAEIISRMTLDASVWGNLPSGFLTSLCKLAASIALLLVWRRFDSLQKLSKVFPPLYFLVMTCCIPLSFFGDSFVAVAGVVTSLVSAVFTVLMTIACVGEGHGSEAPARPFCIFAGLFYLGMAAGDFAGVLSNALVGVESSFFSSIMLVCVYALSVGFFLLMRLQGKRERVQATGFRGQEEKDAAKGGEVEEARTFDQHRVEELGNEYRLSRRERDVLELLAQGRDAPYIAKKLFITENTVRSHVKKIYVKMDIHSRQELFDLVHPEEVSGDES